MFKWMKHSRCNHEYKILIYAVGSNTYKHNKLHGFRLLRCNYCDKKIIDVIDSDLYRLYKRIYYV